MSPPPGTKAAYKSLLSKRQIKPFRGTWESGLKQHRVISENWGTTRLAVGTLRNEGGWSSQSNKMKAEPGEQEGTGLSRWRLWMVLHTAGYASLTVACHGQSHAVTNMAILHRRTTRTNSLPECGPLFCLGF